MPEDPEQPRYETANYHIAWLRQIGPDEYVRVVEGPFVHTVASQLYHTKHDEGLQPMVFLRARDYLMAIPVD
jgi:hypothetical protein